MEVEVREKLREQYPLFFMQMNEAQKKFIRCRNRNGQTPKRRIFEAGNKCGKTHLGIAEDLAHIFGFRPWLEENDPDYKIDVRVPNQFLVGCETLTQSVMQKIWPTLKALIPPTCSYLTKKNPQGHVTQVTFLSDPLGRTCGSELFIRSYDQDADSFEGIDYSGGIH